MSFILADGWLITMNERREILERGSVCVENDRIAAVGTRQHLQQQYPGAEMVDCSGRIVMPGMVNTHTHLFQTLLKGLGDDMVLKKWFTCMTGPSARPPDGPRRACRRAARLRRVDPLRRDDAGGLHVCPPAAGHDQVRRGRVRATGMRGFVCRGFISLGEEYGVPRALIEKPEHAMADAQEQMRRYNKPGGRVQVGVAPNMIWAVDEEGYRLTRKLADEEHVLITTHVAETNFELETAAATYGMNDTEFLSDIGFLGPDVLAVHCVHCTTARHSDSSQAQHQSVS